VRPRYRFTLDGNKVISEPAGWEEIEIVLERDLDYHSLVEKIDIPLEFYNTVDGHDGGYQYLKQVRENGPDSQIEFLIEITFDDVTFETLYSALLDVTTLIEIEHEKIFQCALTRNDIWSYFLNRKSIPVDIQSTTDLDGAVRTPVVNQSLLLTSQEIRKRFSGVIDQKTTYVIPDDQYGIIDFNIVALSEIDQKFDYPLIVSEQIPNYIFGIQEDGTYNFDAVVLASISSLAPVVDINVFFQINEFSNAVAFTKTNHATYSTFSFNASYALMRGDTVRIYFQNANTGPNTIVFEKSIGGETTYLEVIGDTVRTATTADGFYIHDAAYGIINRIVGQTGVFYSEYFGATFTSGSYGDDGCGADYQLFKGKNIRGYTLDEKPFFMAFDDWWEGANKIFNLGLGYEGSLIRVEEKSHFYDDSTNSVELQYVDEIEISYDPDYLLTSIEIGYQKWQAESGSGIDDPQTKHTYSTKFKTVGTREKKDIKILSPFVTASAAIEQTRREEIEAGKDWRMDEDDILIQTNSGASPVTPRLYSSSLITGLINAETRYNARLTPGDNLNRWKNFIANGFQDYPTSLFKFAGGEGNVEMVFNNPAASGCDAEAGTYVNQQGNVLVGTDYLFLPFVYKFTHPLRYTEWKLIRDNRKRSIGITWIDNEGVEQESTLFIKKLSYDINHAVANFECWLKSGFIADEFLMDAGVGSFTLTGQDVGMFRNIAMVADQGSFVLTGQDATLTLLQEIDIQMELFENIVPSTTWVSQFDNGVDPFKQLSVTDNGGTDADTLNAGTSVDVAVSKTTNLGVAEAAGAVIWYKNAVEQDRVTFNITDDVSLNTRTITSVVPTDVLKVEVYEGVTPP
jgi:hypothetical protein